MKLHHLRNATFIIESGEQFILVDPMLGAAHSFMPLSFLRFKPKRNPLVALPPNNDVLLGRVTHCLITHRHPDHLDKKAEDFLIEKEIPVLCSIKDEADLRKKRLNVTQSLKYWEEAPFLNGKITGVPAKHGYGFIAGPMGNVIGFHLALKDEPSIYISSDTIYTEATDKVLTEFKPDISVAACGSAQLDIGQPLLMTLDDIVRFVQKSPRKVVANHLEALNHCPTTRSQLKERLGEEGLLNKVFIPEDGESIDIDHPNIQ